MKEVKISKSVRTITTVNPAPAPETKGYDLLEPLEEKVIRMHYGLSEEDDKHLEYAVAASEDTRLRMTLMEAGNISELDGNVPIKTGMDKSVLRTFVKSFDV